MAEIFKYLALIASLVGLSASALAQEESPNLIWDEYEPYFVEKIETVGPDGLRFSSRPALGGNGYIVQITKQDNGEGRGQVILLHGHPIDGWFQTGELMLIVYFDEYAEIARLFDEAMAKSNDPHIKPSDDNVIFVCTDGPGYLSERITGGQSTELEGSCGEKHPNNLLAVVIEGLIGRAWVDLRR